MGPFSQLSSPFSRWFPCPTRQDSRDSCPLQSSLCTKGHAQYTQEVPFWDWSHQWKMLLGFDHCSNWEFSTNHGFIILLVFGNCYRAVKALNLEALDTEPRLLFISRLTLGSYYQPSWFVHLENQTKRTDSGVTVKRKWLQQKCITIYFYVEGTVSLAMRACLPQLSSNFTMVGQICRV